MATTVANNMIDKLYAYDFGKVLFKPTLIGGCTFRPRRWCLVYFVGHNSAYPNDKGFGIKSWCEVRSDTSAFIDDTVACGWVG